MKTVISGKGISSQDACILVVEDKIDSYITIVRLLAFCGVLHSNSHWKASDWGVVQFADPLPHIDLILLDIGLPHEDGYEVLKEIRATARFKDTLVIAVTGHREELPRARAAGFDGFLCKPLEAERFPSQLSRILKGEAVWECE